MVLTLERRAEMVERNGLRMCLSFVCCLFLLSVGVSAATAENITISGTVVSQVGQIDEPVPNARVSALDPNQVPIQETVCDDQGQFSLEVPDNEYMQFLVEGPGESADYVDTYSAFLRWDEVVVIWPDRPNDLWLSIITKVQAEGVIDELEGKGVEVDPGKGIVGGSVEADDPVPGVKLEVKQGDNDVPCDIVFFDANGELDPDLEVTSSYGGFVIVNIPINTPPGFTDFSISASKEGYVFFFVPFARVYPYQASPEKVTIVPIEGFEADDGDEDVLLDDGGGGGGCFIDTAISRP
jgi:hypothetical protein